MAEKKAVAVFDIDDVFWPLNEHVARIAGVGYGDIVTFHARDNTVLDADARDRLYKAYSHPGLHAEMDFYPGAEEFGELAGDPRLDPWICSNSLDQDVIDNKIHNLRRLLDGNYGRFRTMYNIISMEQSRKKKFPDDVWLLVDDSPMNAVASEAGHVLMPRRPWNTSGWGREVLAPIASKVLYYSTPHEACSIARELMDRELGRTA